MLPLYFALDKLIMDAQSLIIRLYFVLVKTFINLKTTAIICLSKASFDCTGAIIKTHEALLPGLGGASIIINANGPAFLLRKGRGKASPLLH